MIPLENSAYLLFNWLAPNKTTLCIAYCFHKITHNKLLRLPIIAVHVHRSFESPTLAAGNFDVYVRNNDQISAHSNLSFELHDQVHVIKYANYMALQRHNHMFSKLLLFLMDSLKSYAQILYSVNQYMILKDWLSSTWQSCLFIIRSI